MTTPTTTFTDARVCTATGGDPFEGTVVVAGDRIAEVVAVCYINVKCHI
jgi:hypothetical protein